MKPISVSLLCAIGVLGHAPVVAAPVGTDAVSQIELEHGGHRYGAVQSPRTGRIWLDRNLGAQRVCERVEDEACFGDYYQWGRPADGHEKAASPTSKTEARTIAPDHGEFVIESDDWTIMDSDGVRRERGWAPCPDGFRVPSVAELKAEFFDEDERLVVTPSASVLKVPAAGFRYGYMDGAHLDAHRTGVLWSATFDKKNYFGAWSVVFEDDAVRLQIDYETNGFSVRCIDDPTRSPGDR
ncbi:MAG: hypothetical protein KDH20_03115 [Rhodocyclaceae bacterium]|nr:hypothetical protein [Rhodocyclaceae bacterium]